jgi:deazaflavin-dependent oxidoreductase (nitroreductase family)
MSDFNRTIIDEFRANDGKVGGMFDGARLLLLHTTGARRGREHVTPLVYEPVGDGDGMLIFGSKGGAPTHPDWYHNLTAHPDTTVEVGGDTVAVRAREVEGDEYARLWQRQVELMPGLADYQAKTTRRIPLLVLDPR